MNKTFSLYRKDKMPKKTQKTTNTQPPKTEYSEEDLEWALYFSECYKDWFDFVLRWPKHTHHDMFKHFVAQGLIIHKPKKQRGCVICDGY
jgi:hypothetical protein